MYLGFQLRLLLLLLFELGQALGLLLRRLLRRQHGRRCGHARSLRPNSMEWERDWGSIHCRAACRPVARPGAERWDAPGAAAPSAIDRFFNSSAGAAAIPFRVLII